MSFIIYEYVSKNTHKSISFISLGQLRYLSALKYVDAVVGNSSSGLLEAPSFKIGTINIGDRQKGRIMAKSIIQTKEDVDSIKKAFIKLYSKQFQNILKTVVNHYDNGKTSKKIIKILKNTDLQDNIKKSFYEL